MTLPICWIIELLNAGKSCSALTRAARIALIMWLKSTFSVRENFFSPFYLHKTALVFAINMEKYFEPNIFTHFQMCTNNNNGKISWAQRSTYRCSLTFFFHCFLWFTKWRVLRRTAKIGKMFSIVIKNCISDSVCVITWFCAKKVIVKSHQHKICQADFTSHTPSHFRFEWDNKATQGLMWNFFHNQFD